MTERCNCCQRRLDRPGPFVCQNERHPEPTLAQRIVNVIEHDLNGRRGFEINMASNDAQDDILDAWEALIEKELTL